MGINKFSSTTVGAINSDTLSYFIIDIKYEIGIESILNSE